MIDDIMPKSPEAKKAMNKRTDEWRKGHTTSILLRLNRNTDADIIDRMDSVESKMGYIKMLIRADIAKNPTHPKPKKRAMPQKRAKTPQEDALDFFKGN